MSSKSPEKLEIYFIENLEDNQEKLENNKQNHKQQDLQQSQLFSLLINDLPPLELYLRQTKTRKRSLSNIIESDELTERKCNQTKSQVDFFDFIDPNPLMNLSIPPLEQPSVKISSKELPNKPKEIISSCQETPFLNTSLDKNDQLTRTSCHCFYPTSHMIYLDQKVDMNHLWMKYLLPNPLMESITIANYDLSSTSSVSTTIPSQEPTQENLCQCQTNKLNQQDQNQPHLISQECKDCQECHEEKLSYQRTYVMSKFIDYEA